MYKILIVDDEERVLETLEQKVNWRQCGINHVFKAGNIKHAQETIEKFRPEILLTDIEMPNGSGIELISWVKKEHFPIECLVITCHPDFNYMRSSIQLGTKDYILKPVDYEELFFVLARLTSRLDEERIPAEQKEACLELVHSGNSIRANYVGEYIAEQVEIVTKDYIKKYLADNINISDIARELHCSEKHVSREFKKKTGMTVGEYITYERMNMAKTMLAETGWSIQTIASRAGYDDYSYFARVFRKETGESPSRYRYRKKTMREMS